MTFGLSKNYPYCLQMNFGQVFTPPNADHSHSYEKNKRTPTSVQQIVLNK